MLYDMREFFGREQECDLGMGREWEWNSTILGMGMGIARWEWEGAEIKNQFPNTSSRNQCKRREFMSNCNFAFRRNLNACSSRAWGIVTPKVGKLQPRPRKLYIELYDYAYSFC